MPKYAVRASVVAVAALLLVPAPASALPIFAHRYHLTCQQCHTTVPQLNTFGQAFRRNGFRLPGPADGTMPVAVKIQSTYSSAGGDSDEGEPLPKAIVDEIEILSAGSIGRNASYFFEQYVVDGGVAGRPRDIWIDLAQHLGSDPAGPSLHSRIGEFTLPLPVDPETERPTLAHYALFDQSVGGNAFTLFDPRVGVDNYFTDDRSGLETHLVLAQAVDRGSGSPSTGIDAMATFSKTIGDDLSAYAYRYQGQRRLGAIEDRFARDGYGLAYGRGKFELTALVQQGYDTSANGYGSGALSSGGFLQAGWHFSGGVELYARYDDTYDPFTLRRGSALLSLVTRPARNMRFTLEGSRESEGAYELAGGWLFAY